MERINNIPTLVLRGIKNRAHGKAFEDLISRSFDMLERDMVCCIEKTPEPMKVLRPVGEGRFLCCFSKKAQPDYKGTMSGGQSIVIEAKHTEKDSISASVVTSEQAKKLNVHAALGARCFVLSELGYDHYLVPWDVWRQAKTNFGKLTMTKDDLAPYFRPVSGGVLLLFDHKGE